MTEASVLSSFLTALRKRLPEAVVMKHHDASFIGMPDVSVTVWKCTFWFEAKLIDASRGDIKLRIQSRLRGSSTQTALMEKLAYAGSAAWFIIWERKTAIHFYHPITEELRTEYSTATALDWVVNMMQAASQLLNY